MSSEALNGDKPRMVLSYVEMKGLFDDGVVGTIEFRNWLSRVDEAFALVRDRDIDDEITELAAAKLENLRNQRQRQQQPE